MVSSRLLLLPVLLAMAPSHPAVPSDAAALYVEGLDALNDVRWLDSTAAFTKALDTNALRRDVRQIGTMWYEFVDSGAMEITEWTTRNTRRASAGRHIVLLTIVCVMGSVGPS